MLHGYLPFAEARAYVRQLRLPTQRDYIEWAKTGDRPPSIPAGPYNIYGNEWESWADWLGTRGADGYLPFEEARAYARHQHFPHRKAWHEHATSPEFPGNLLSRIRELIAGAAARNPDLCVLGMSATPVINDLYEARTLVELVTGQDLSHLPTRPTVPNAILYHQLLTKHGLRYRPNYPQTIETLTPIIDGTDVLPQLRRVQRRDVLAMEQAVLQAKLPIIQSLVKPGTLIYTPFVTGIIEPLIDTVQAAGLRAGVFTGDDKSGYEQFLTREVDVLIGSEPIGTGVDKLQEVGNKLIFASLPWTSAQYDQVVGRLHRQGMRFDKVEVHVPIVELRQGQHIWSWDRRRLNRIQFKRTLADAAVDGVIPEGKLPSHEEMQAHSLQALQQWISQVEQGAPTPSSTSSAASEPDLFDILSGE